MKKILLMLAFALVALAGCKKDPMPGQDATASESPANCYIVSQAGTYSFKTVKGNSSESVGKVASAVVLWESFGTDVAPAVGDLVKSVSYKKGKIVFKTTDKKGNAVIAAKDAAGNILWSWHIWMTDQPQEQEYYNEAGTMMDRNLGATSATPGDVGVLGLLYQWGRKDPFLGSSSISSGSIAESTITWPSGVNSNSTNGTIAYATANPTTFIANKHSNYDWYYTGSESTDNTRWTTSDKAKSIYDPCPAGWRVPDGGKDGVWSKALETSSIFYDWDFDDVNLGVNWWGNVWYPASGFRSNDDGSLGYVGNDGYYWAASPVDPYAHCMCFYDGGAIYPWRSFPRTSGISVRCVKE